MSICYIIGGADYPHIVPTENFIIGTNFHHINANILVAIDEPIIRKILYDNIEGFNTQPLFTNKKVGQYYTDQPRCLIFDYQAYYNTSSPSSGILAIALASFLGFTEINIIGFDYLLQKHKNIFCTIHDKTKKYKIYDRSNNYITY